MSLTAGVASATINPAKPMFLVGYPHVPRTSTGVNDPLYANALCLDNGKNTLISIAADILWISAAGTKRCRDKITAATGVPASHILISTSHTHSAPITLDMVAWQDDPVVPPADPEYIEFLENTLAQVAIHAYNQRTPASIAVTTAQIEGVGCNRHHPDGPRDSEVGLLYLKRQDNNQPLALQLIYSMHPTVLHEDSTLISADFPGYTRMQITEDLPGVTLLYHNGPCGNLSPRYHVTSQTFAEADRLGRKLGQAVVAAVQKLQDQDFTTDITLDAIQKHLQLPARQFCSVAEAEKLLAESRAEYQRLKDQHAPHGPVRTAECAVFGAEERLTLAHAQQTGKVQQIHQQYNPVEVQVLRIGSTYLVGLQGECFVEYALEIKRHAPAKTFVISLANGELQGYIVTPDAVGYEAGNSFFLPESGTLMAQAAIEGIKQLES
ncbi:MAG: neutral/alkaline non-lysosomal ceramidase N-terminal domain-containing protein [Sedimentisphaerales bacterium]|nr:neutral/alkaline non-lysosomal ceramidase N-terminal domain-containing protein [Sedimentisphaerales bacterium]